MAAVFLPGPDAWPAHGREVRPWHQAGRGGTRDDRMLRDVTVWLPPKIADRDPFVASGLAAQIEDCLREVASLDASHGSHLGALGTMLLRTESVASSKIEQVEADVVDYARALHGMKSNQSATSMAAATVALEQLISSVEGSDLTADAVLRSHRALMRDDPSESAYAGRIRDMQNWIGGSDHSPRNALYVPPPPDTVADYLADLVAFANRDDLSAMVQAAIVHAQLESIHPFTDGNGRIGRALVNTVLRRRSVTTTVVVPLASALVARREAYFDVLNRYREGDPEPIIAAFAKASRLAAQESRTTAVRMAGFPEGWRDAVGRVRSDSATLRLLEVLLQMPVFSAAEAEVRVGGTTSAVYRAVDALVDAQVLRPLTDRKRHQVWGVGDMLDELDDLSVRIGAAALAEEP
ncbi:MULTISPECIES: Fic family protein [unclassified Nocardioides]|uniref:Fic family protein n=1 Tax=unclassified Nocardioides TaxID=2615069 RepID=UPI0006F810D6|nr:MULTISPECIES: Fic family protein [unclassified Nocardioides]KRA32627.1 fic protein [Nocardioides sp. Root614]KRA89280.1 fic protein [Nocardioides sp. Root682]